MEENVYVKPEKTFNTADIAFAFAMLICGFLFWDLIEPINYGAGVTIFAVVIFGASFIYLLKSKIKQGVGGVALLILAGLGAAQFMLFDNLLICGLNFIFLIAVFIYWICLSTGRRIDNKLSIYIIGDAVKQILRMPFMNLGCCASGIKVVFKQKKLKGILPALAGIVIFLPLIAIVINLLVSADFAFEHFIKYIFGRIRMDEIINYIAKFVFGIPVAFYIYGLVYGNVKGRYADKITVESVDRAAQRIKFAPKMMIYSVLTVFNTIYFLFFAVQAAYLFSAFNGALPEQFTYAEYARRGFFELCAVAGINLGVLVVSHLFIKRGADGEPLALRLETLIISLFTMLLIATALSKMGMYIYVYGLTQLRVFTSWFMLMMFFVFAVICVRQIRKFNSTKLIVLGCVFWFMVLSYGNVDGLIARSNISRFEAGTLTRFDIVMLTNLSDAAVPPMYDYFLRTDEDDVETRQAIASAIMSTRAFPPHGFRGFNYQRDWADKIRAALSIEGWRERGDMHGQWFVND